VTSRILVLESGPQKYSYIGTQPSCGANSSAYLWVSGSGTCYGCRNLPYLASSLNYVIESRTEQRQFPCPGSLLRISVTMVESAICDASPLVLMNICICYNSGNIPYSATKSIVRLRHHHPQPRTWSDNCDETRVNHFATQIAAASWSAVLISDHGCETYHYFASCLITSKVKQISVCLLYLATITFDNTGVYHLAA